MVTINLEQTAAQLIRQRADVCGGYKPFTVRIADGKIALCTSTYNYSQPDETKGEIARRLAALWNIALDVPTAELEAADASGFKLKR